MKVIGWFFFDLILLGYVEDPVTGLSVSIPGGMDWRIYVEVPSRISSESPKASLDQFIEEIPALGMLGVSHPIDPSTPYTVDEDVQLVCKYLKAYWVFREQTRSKGINKLFREVCEWGITVILTNVLISCSICMMCTCVLLYNLTV